MKVFMASYLVLSFIVCLVLRWYVVWRATGVNPMRLGSGDSAHDFVGRMFKLVLVAILGVVLAYLFPERFYRFLIPLETLESTTLQGIGVGVLVFAFAVCALAQVHLGKSWRIGIDHQNETALVENGIYRYSRNPIFSSLVASIVGLFLIAPTAVTLFLVVLAYVLAAVQVRLEEEHLAKRHDARYAEFCRRVPRWI